MEQLLLELIARLNKLENRVDGLSKPEITKNNYAATSNPTSGDDFDDGYTIGSTWINTSTNDIFICVDDTNGAAIWYQVVAGA